MAELERRSALVVAAALRGDEDTVHVLVATLPPDQLARVCEGVIQGLAGLIQQFVPGAAIARGVAEAQRLAQQAATERTTS
ncbi:hypothetical protein AB0N99_21230 [Streptomyces sp. NPDC093272]|uniref:hypothetical protein n=1 Tax=Streptomyces sp. NPDC093272 TaxID=3154981 RepID=UPI00344AD2D7